MILFQKEHSTLNKVLEISTIILYIQVIRKYYSIELLYIRTTRQRPWCFSGVYNSRKILSTII